MRAKISMTFICVWALVLLVGCGGNDTPQDAGGSTGNGSDIVGSWKFSVDIDNASLNIGTPFSTSTVTTVDGHTVEVKNGPAGCIWTGGTSTLSCEVIIQNLDSDECMYNVRSRFGGSTNPAAIMADADYTWPGPAVTPNSSLSINGSGYCITEDSPSSAGSTEGCEGTWQGSISPGGVATVFFNFTNVPTGNYSFLTAISATYQACSAPAGMSRIPAGCFEMGDHFGEGVGDGEIPVHSVCLTNDFYMDQHEVTNAEYAACVGTTFCSAPSRMNSFTNDPYYGNAAFNNFPVLYVSWNQAVTYCSYLGKRLPTDAEWEYSARGGLSGKRYAWGNSISGSNANYMTSGDPYDDDTTPVGYFPPNGYGLHDMAGNIWEWAADWYASDYYSTSPIDNPTGPATGLWHIMRGGNCIDDIYTLRVSWRSWNIPTYNFAGLGFRCADD